MRVPKNVAAFASPCWASKVQALRAYANCQPILGLFPLALGWEGGRDPRVKERAVVALHLSERKFVFSRFFLLF